MTQNFAVNEKLIETREKSSAYPIEIGNFLILSVKLSSNCYHLTQNNKETVFVTYNKSPHMRTYQNKNLEAVFPKLCTL